VTLYTGSVLVPRKRSRFWAKIGGSTAFAVGLPLLLVVLWGVWSTVAPSLFFPGPLTILEAFVDTWIGPAFLTDVLPSLGRLALAIVLSVLLGIAAGTVIGLVRWLRELLEPVLEFFRAIPPPVLIPVAMLLMGITDTMRVVVIVAGSIWPVLLNTIDGVRSTDSVMTETARSFSLTRAERIRFLVLPAASPRIMTGVRQSLSIALIMMVISEMFSSSSGLGYQIVYFQRNFLIAEMWSGILLLGLVGVVLATVFGFAERRVLRWYHGIREVERV
jgi:ABC-type nitrate/sulfonate/bicarbonate transport system permease component